MSLGERATIAIPPHLAFGDEEEVGQHDVVIPANSIVVYDIVLLKVGERVSPNDIYESLLGKVTPPPEGHR
jgi:hypothetical protein